MCAFRTDKGGEVLNPENSVDVICTRPPPSIEEREGGVSNAAARQKQIDSSSSFLNIFPALLVNFCGKGIGKVTARFLSLLLCDNECDLEPAPGNGDFAKSQSNPVAKQTSE